nr:hypothetical protein [Mucilaginibacter sp. X4EP1]
METLNIIGSITSIISLLISLFALNKVISIKNDIRNNGVVQSNNKVTVGNIIGGDENKLSNG